MLSVSLCAESHKRSSENSALPQLRMNSRLPRLSMRDMNRLSDLGTDSKLSRTTGRQQSCWDEPSTTQDES
jgi:hypothetical protein